MNPTVLPETQASPNAATTPNPFHVAPADVQQAQIASAQPQAGLKGMQRKVLRQRRPTPLLLRTRTQTHQLRQTPNRRQLGQATRLLEQKGICCVNGQTRPLQPKFGCISPRGRTGSVHSRVMGITSDGRLILRLPSGRTAIVAPDDEESAPRHRNRGYIDRDQMFGPPPGSGPHYFPDD